MIWSYKYVVDVACVVGGERGIFYRMYQIGECGVGRHWRLLVTITSLDQCVAVGYCGA